MLQHPGIEFQLQGFFNRVRFTAFVTRLLHHAKHPIVSLNMIVGALPVFPPQKDDHLVKLVFTDFLERFTQKGVGLVQRIVDHACTARASTWLGNTFFKEAVKLLVELSKALECGGNLQHDCQVFLVLLTEVVWFADYEILMLPDEGGLLLFAHATSTLSLVLGCLARTPPTLLASLVALPLEAVFDRPHPVQNQLIHLFDDMKDAQLMLDISPVPLPTVFVEGRAIGNGHLDMKTPIYEGL